MTTLAVHEIVPVDHASVEASRVIVGTSLVTPLLLALACFLLARSASRRARVARASHQPSKTIALGEAVLRGRVALARDEPTAVRIEIEQRGSEARRKTGWEQTWKEERRKTTARPFYLEEERGMRIRIEPPDDVRMVDDLDATIALGPNLRRRVGELAPGETIYARGDLVDATDPEMPRSKAIVLRRPRHGHMLLSTAPLSQPFERRARSYRRWLVAYLIGVVPFLFLNLPYATIAVMGQRAVGTVTAKDRGTNRAGKNTFSWYRLNVLTPADWAFAAYVAPSVWKGVAEGDRVAILYVPSSPGAYSDPFDLTGARLGAGPSQYHAVGIAALGLFAAMLALQVAFARQSRPWYEAKLVETADGRVSTGARA